MKVAIIGSRNLLVRNLGDYLPADTEEIVSGGARGIDSCAREYAKKNGIKLTEFLPDYERYGKRAPLLRNLEIIDHADLIIAFWDGISRGTKYTIENAKLRGKPVTLLMPVRK